MALPDGANSRVVLIGFSAFADFPKIPAVPNNLRRLKDVFADEKVGGIGRKHITTITGLRGLSRDTLLSRLQRVAKEATDTLVVYYVGHGFLDEDDNDSLLLALPGTRRRQHFSALPYEEIRRAVRNAGARRKVVILDCCYSGRAHSGGFLAGFFPVLMFGLPGAALAMWRAAPPHRRSAVGGIMISAALTAFVTGVTEPIEFAFMFVAPVLYAVHVVLTGVSMAILNAAGAQLGFGFSAGGIDMLLNASKDNTKGLPLIIGMGVLYFVIYYFLFKFLIVKFDFATPGREPEDVESVAADPGSNPELAGGEKKAPRRRKQEAEPAESPSTT